ncbi:MAG: ABC transporter ATP-binding protein [Deltaproteobacteria bacterium]|nr:ABC transporter ATP-binding protein [Deltaproteobacteria bacterium]
MGNLSREYNGSHLAGNDLSKAFGKIRAVQGVSLQLPPGEVTVLLGLNGAGKSTLLNMLSGSIKPDAGQVCIGEAPLKPTMVGLCPQGVTLWPDLTPREQLEMMGECYNLKPDVLQKRINHLLERLKIKSLQNRQAGTLSGGMQQRVNVALALIHDPSVVILDEPMQGLDPESRRLLRELIHDIAQTRQSVVVVSTHDIDEAEQMADRVAIMHEGRLLVLETKDELKQQREAAGVIRIRIPLEEQHAALQDACQAHKLAYEMDKTTFIIRSSQTDATTRWLLDTTKELKIKTSGLSVSESSLEDILFEWAQSSEAQP